MAAEDHRTKTVDQLKDYLRQRGISTSNKRKNHLLRLAEAADTIDVDTIDGDESYEQASVERRTVTINGRTRILEDFFCISSEKWIKDLKFIPNIDFSAIFIYLSQCCQWTYDRIRQHKDDNSYKLFMQNHVDNVSLYKHNNDYLYIKATCLPETRQSDSPYICWILMDTAECGSVKAGGCTCVADDGGCKHCIALLFALQAFCERHKDRGSETGTDIQCTWDKPRRVSNPSVIRDLQYRKKGHNCDDFCPVSEPTLSKADIQSRLLNVCKEYGSVMTQNIDSEFEFDEEAEVHNNLENYPTLPVIINQFIKTSPNATNEMILEHLKSVHSDEYLQNVQKLTCNIEDEEAWRDHRKGRITASIMGSVVRCRLDKLDEDNYLVREIMGLSNKYCLPATDYGKTMEKVALSQYSIEHKQGHTKSVVSYCGLFVIKTYPFIGATPDALVKCSCCGNGLVEIKCSYSYQQLSPTEVATQVSNYNLYLEDGTNNVKLKRNTKWYTQIQTQLGVTGLPWCDFIFFTRKGFSVENIAFDPEYFEECVKKSKEFFMKFLLSKF